MGKANKCLRELWTQVASGKSTKMPPTFNIYLVYEPGAFVWVFSILILAANTSPKPLLSLGIQWGKTNNKPNFGFISYVI